jgi:transcriptional regulator with XRE-family HTH domain
VLDLRIALGLRIEEVRTSLQLRREELAALVGIQARHVANCELYGAWPEPETLQKIANAFGLDVHDLVNFSDTRKIPLLPLEKRLNNRESRSKKIRSRRKSHARKQN